MESEISFGVRKLSRIFWLKKHKTINPIKKILKKKANQDIPVIEKRKNMCNWKKRKKMLKKDGYED